MSHNYKKPTIIDFSRVGDSSTGYISIAEKEKLPFVPKRIYWTYFTPEDVVRGFHSHYKLEQVLIAMAGKITLKIETLEGELFEFVLDTPDKGVYIPKQCWRTMKYSHNAVQVCIASMEYNEDDYIRDYELFKGQ